MNLYAIILGLYLLGLVLIGLIGIRRVATQEDFSVAGRSLNTFVLFGTMLATWIGTGSIFGNAEKAYQVGIAAIIIPVGALGGIAILSLLAARARGLAQITIQDLLEERYNAAARLFGVVALVLAYLTIVSYQYRAAGAVLNLVFPEISYSKAVIVSALFIIIYTAVSGMVSIARIGLVQGITIIVGILLALPVFYQRAGGLQGMSQRLDSSHLELFGPIGFLEAMGLILPAMLLVLGDANMYQRFFSARNAGTARKAILWTLGGVAVMEMAIILTAWVASSLEPDLEIPGRVIAYAARDFLPPFLGALLLTSIMAIILSTAGSYLLSPSTAIIRDIYQRFLDPGASERRMVILLRVVVTGCGLLAYWLATLSDEFLSVALLAYTIYGAAITPALIASFFWRRATGKGAVASILSGIVVTLVWKWQGPEVIDPVIPAIFLSILALVIVSLVDSPPAREKVDPFFR